MLHKSFFLTFLLSLGWVLHGQVPYNANTFFADGLNVPNQMVFDTSGNLFVVNHSFASYSGPYYNTIAKVDPTGTKSVFLGGYTWPSSIVIDSQQNLYFTQNNATNNITKVSSAAVASNYATLPHQPGPVTLFENSTGITLYTVSHWGVKGIYRTTAPGVFSLFDGGSFLGCQVTPDGQYLYAWTSDTIYRFNTVTQAKQVWVSILQNLEIFAHAIGPDSNLYLAGRSVCDTSAKAVFRINGSEDITEIISQIPLQNEINGLAIKGLYGSGMEVYLSEVVNGNRMSAAANRIIRFQIPTVIPSLTFQANLLGNDTILCSPITLNVGQAGLFQSQLWSTNVTTPSVTAGVPGLYYVDAWHKAGCILSDTILLHVCQSNPAAGNPDTLICSGESVGLFAPALTFASYLWSTNDTTPVITVTPSVTTTYNVMVTNGIDTLYDTCVVYVAFAEAGMNDTLCFGDSLQLAGIASAASYQWSPSAGLSSTAVLNPMAQPQSSVSYYLTVQHQISGFSATCTDSVSITLIPLPQPQLGNDVNVCQGSAVTLGPGPGYNSYLWSTLDTTVTLGVAMGGTYWVVVEDTFGCRGSDTIEVAFIPYPQVTMQPAIDTVCQGSPQIIKALSNLSSVVYNWSTSASSDSIVVTPVATTTYKVTVSHQGCLVIDSSVIHTKHQPEPYIYTTKYNFCNGDSATLQAVSLYAASTSFQWSTGQVGQIIQIAPSVSTTYTVTATLNGCAGDTSLQIEVKPIPQIGMVASPQMVCLGDTTKLTALSNIWGTVFNWSTGHIGTQILITPTVSGQVKVTGTVNGCSSADSLFLTIKQVPTVHLLVGQNPICAGDSVLLSATSSMANASYIWSTAMFTPQITVSPAVNTTYTVTATVSGCYSDTSVVIEVNPSPQLTVTPSPIELCDGETVVIDVVSDMPGTVYGWSNGMTGTPITLNPTATFLLTLTGTAANCTTTLPLTVDVTPMPTVWLGEDGYVCEGEPVTLNPTGSFQALEWWDGSTQPMSIIYQPGTYWVKALNGKCEVVDSVFFDECPTLKVPNVFTPNSDGFNDAFYPVFASVELKSIHIYSRWGSLVYFTDEPSGKWDGTQHGIPCSEGVYYYIIRYFNPKFGLIQEKAGAVQLLR